MLTELLRAGNDDLTNLRPVPLPNSNMLGPLQDEVFELIYLTM